MPDETLLQPAPQFPQASVQLTPDGLAISIVFGTTGLSITQGVNAETVHAITRQWVRAHPELQDELLAETVAARRNELELIKSINASRND